MINPEWASSYKSERMGTCSDAVSQSLQHQNCRLAADQEAHRLWTGASHSSTI